jgi:hypothetical protein
VRLRAAAAATAAAAAVAAEEPPSSVEDIHPMIQYAAALHAC